LETLYAVRCSIAELGGTRSSTVTAFGIIDMTGSNLEILAFGPFRLSPATRKLERDDVPVALGDRALDLLITLVEQAGEVISHRDLIGRTWRGLVVSPTNLRVHMANLRKALGDGEKGERYIENVTGQGYCFVAPVTRHAIAGSSAHLVDVEKLLGADLVAERCITVMSADASDLVNDSGEHPRVRPRESYISDDVEYALHGLLFLLDLSGTPVAMRIRDLADLQGIPTEELDRIFKQLLAAGIVVSTELAGGGYALARPPEKITFLDVIVAIDGRRPLFDCKNVRARCALFGGKAPLWATKGVCAIHAVMMEAEVGMRTVLASRTLPQIASRVAAKVPPTFVDVMSNWLSQRAEESRQNS
jgi:Rrf2 family protein